MKEACEYVKNSRIERARKHRLEVTRGDFCKSFTDKQYKRVKIRGKGAGQKGKKYSHTKLWADQNLSHRVHTIYHDNTFKK